MSYKDVFDLDGHSEKEEKWNDPFGEIDQKIEKLDQEEEERQKQLEESIEERERYLQETVEKLYALVENGNISYETANQVKAIFDPKDEMLHQINLRKILVNAIHDILEREVLDRKSIAMIKKYYNTCYPLKNNDVLEKLRKHLAETAIHAQDRPIRPYRLTQLLRIYLSVLALCFLAATEIPFPIVLLNMGILVASHLVYHTLRRRKNLRKAYAWAWATVPFLVIESMITNYFLKQGVTDDIIFFMSIYISTGLFSLMAAFYFWALRDFRYKKKGSAPRKGVM